MQDCCWIVNFIFVCLPPFLAGHGALVLFIYLSFKCSNCIGKTQVNGRETSLQIPMKGFLMLNDNYLSLCMSPLSPGKQVLRVNSYS